MDWVAIFISTIFGGNFSSCEVIMVKQEIRKLDYLSRGYGGRNRKLE